ncbi:hypothetical protein PIIN_04415 [Serendipita indica DSM 11827]|uniref:INO80 complex subunit F domain-containing protein n=1 Tax=Serendipita indica (strain DSM 11827) TaxID=1109443 RepID=G4TGM7_SERID|nr:hypothetical protein PIIN_04415 [Serendipita indica DSM 11827]
MDGVVPAPSVAAPAGGGQAPPRTKSKAYQTTIAAEADDLKYESKYKELKKKVKEVEEDNEQLYVKILQAQQSIQRLRLERALIYERLGKLAPPQVAPVPQPVHVQSIVDDHPHPHHPPAASSSTVPAAHQPHPLSQSFTATHRDQERDARSNGPPAPYTSIPRERDPVSSAYQYSSSRTGPPAAPLPPMKDVPMHTDDVQVPHHPLPRKRPSQPSISSSAAVLPPLPAVQYDSARYHPQPRESDERGRRHSPGAY